MQRSFSTPALVLRVRSSGESNREAVFLSAEEGLLSATLFGGPKSRLRSHVSPFNSGILWTYRDPAKDFRKVSDFDVQSWRPGLRELYERSNTASLIAGTILGGHGGGGAFAETFALANAALDALESADEACCERLFIHFLWNWAGLLGNRGTGLQFCTSCACEFTDDAVLWFIPGEGFLCKSCITREYPAIDSQSTGYVQYAGNKTGAVLGPGSRRWLRAVEGKSPSELSRISPDAASLRELKALITMLGKQ
ncbi:MAG: recombination protein O N-terminal domain-containing protein [Treponema sp.]|nr:recombination protein O N-terminal domain-containing protein [Treponema sp.]